ncbi:EthD domain-containing protein [Parahaliea mediterranea]|uniref:EthD domain-containing protein n=1 Tax=Parahaliea mediterranea TaxID=651086 RepID=UPI00130031CC|nr:EthD domain-containing protein [Parahaliea mediterranea]
MEKLIYPLWAKTDGDALRETLLNETIPALRACEGTRAVRLTVADSAVASAAPKRIERLPPAPVAVVSLWLDNGGDRAAQEALLAGACERFDCLLVTEAEPIVNRDQPPAADGRVPGWCQVVFLETPPRLSRQQWLDIWQGSHTRVAIDVQANFAYRQNVVVRAFCEGERLPDAMIEEDFPAAAMTSDHAFYGAQDDDELQRRVGAMMDSCARFIDFDRMDVLPMSEYIFGDLLTAQFR